MTKELTLNKVAAALVGVAMMAGLAFAVAAERAHAISLGELVELFIALDIIPEDKADEARAAIPAGSEGSTPSVSCNFTRNLSTGDTGSDVMDLQKLLNANGFVVAVSGAGSAGNETQYYGPATASAVASMQEAFASDILAPLGLTAGTGYFGASTRAKANELCASDMPDMPEMDEDEEMDEEEEMDEDLSSSEASLEDFDRMGSPSGVEVQEGDEEVKVAGWDFDVEDGDISIRRVDVRFDSTSGTGSTDPWDYFEAIQLYVDGDMVAEEAADDEDDWNDIGSGVYEMRFSGLSETVMEDDKAEIVVGVTMNSSLDSDEENQEWTVWVPAQGVRARDGAGIDQYTGDANALADAAHEQTFSTEGAGQDDELKVRLDSSNPDASIIKVDEDDDTDGVTVLVFELEAEGNDLEIDTLPVHFTISDAFDDMIADLVLEVDGVEFDDWTKDSVADTSASVSTTTVTFDFDNDLTIDEDETVTVKVIVDFKPTDDYDEGDTVKAEVRGVDADAITGEGGDDLTASTNSGSAIGETHQLLSSGIFAEVVSVDETKTAGDNNTDDVGDYEIKFDLTAFEETYYVSATSTAVFVYRVENSSGATVSTTTNAAITSTATRQGDAYRLNEGDAETFTLTVTLNPDVTGFYRIELDSIDFGSSAENTTDQTAHTASPDEDFETGNLYLNA